MRHLLLQVPCSFAAILGNHVLVAWIRLRHSPGARRRGHSLDIPSQMLRRFQLAFHERLVDGHFYDDIGDFFLFANLLLACASAQSSAPSKDGRGREKRYLLRDRYLIVFFSAEGKLTRMFSNITRVAPVLPPRSYGS